MNFHDVDNEAWLLNCWLVLVGEKGYSRVGLGLPSGVCGKIIACHLGLVDVERFNKSCSSSRGCGIHIKTFFDSGGMRRHGETENRKLIS